MNMYNLSITPLDKNHIEEISADLIAQQRDGVSTHAMMMMYFSPIGTPAENRAEEQCKVYDKYREILDKAGAKHGVLVQSTMGHIVIPSPPHTFTDTVFLPTGEKRASTVCPLDENFRVYIKEQMRILATRRPSLVMIDDDVGLLYRNLKGCACPLHMAEFNRRAGTSMTREALYAHTQSKSEESKKYTEIYVNLQRDGLLGAVKAMREGLDEIDPTIQGITSGIYTSTFCEFSDEMAEIFAGKGNPKIIRMNNGMYTAAGARNFTKQMYRAAILKENTKKKIDVYLAETDTCPQNRYSTSAQLLHAHFTGTILEGAKGAKHWITRTQAYEPSSGIAYRKKLAKYAKFYERLSEIADDVKPFGCRIPLPLIQDYGFIKSEAGINLSPWSTCVIERLGLPLYFGNDGDGAVFIDDHSHRRFTDEQIKEFFRGTVFMTSLAQDALTKRGFGDMIGVESREYNDTVGFELINGTVISSQVGSRELIIKKDGVEVYSEACKRLAHDAHEVLFPAVVGYENPLGGYTVTFSGTPDTEFRYFSAFSMLCETRKKQFIKILEKRSHLPIYYPDDSEIYLRAGYLKDEIFAAVFNISLDEVEELRLTVKTPVKNIEYLDENGTRVPLSFRADGENIVIEKRIGVLEPLILFIS